MDAWCEDPIELTETDGDGAFSFEVRTPPHDVVAIVAKFSEV